MALLLSSVHFALFFFSFCIYDVTLSHYHFGDYTYKDLTARYSIKCDNSRTASKMETLMRRCNDKCKNLLDIIHSTHRKLLPLFNQKQKNLSHLSASSSIIIFLFDSVNNSLFFFFNDKMFALTGKKSLRDLLFQF